MSRLVGTGGPLVSVLIPSYNYAKYLPTAIESVLRQTYRNFELIIVDNASTDDSLAIARSYAARDERVQVHANDHNIGLAPNFERAWGLSRGTYVTTLCADDAFLPDHLSRAVNYYATHPDVDLFFTSYLWMDENGVVTERLDMPAFHGSRSHSGRDEFQQLLEYENFVCFPTILFKRELVERLGYLDARVKILADYELVIRYAKLGVKFGYVDAPSVIVRRHENNRSGVACFVVGGAQLDEFLTIWELHLDADRLRRLTGRRPVMQRVLEKKLAELRSADPEHADAIIARQAPRIEAMRTRMAQIPNWGTSKSSSHPRVSIVLPTVGNVGFLVDALRSIEAQSYEDYEIVVVAEAAPVLDGIVSLLRRPDRVRLVALDQRLGPARARNVGILFAAGELIAYLDEDDLWKPDHLASAVPFFDDVEIDVVKMSAVATVEHFQRGAARCRRPMATSSDVFHRGSGPWVGVLAQRTPISAVLHRRTMVDSVGLFNQTMPILEGHEFLLRAARRRCAVVDRETVDVRFRLGLSLQLIGERVAHYSAVASQLAAAYGISEADRDASIGAVFTAVRALSEAPSDPGLVLQLMAAFSGAGLLERV